MIHFFRLEVIGIYLLNAGVQRKRTKQEIEEERRFAYFKQQEIV